MSTYPIFNNKDNKTLVFYACAKNANTSAKLFFAKHLGIENNFYFTEDDIPRYKTRESLNLVKEKRKVQLLQYKNSLLTNESILKIKKLKK